MMNVLTMLYMCIVYTLVETIESQVEKETTRLATVFNFLINGNGLVRLNQNTIRNANQSLNDMENTTTLYT